MNNNFWTTTSNEVLKPVKRKKQVSSSAIAVKRREIKALELATKRPVTGKELSDLFGMSPTGGSKILSRLKKQGLVDKVGHRHYAATSSVTTHVEPEIKQPVATPLPSLEPKGMFLQLNDSYQEYCDDIENFALYLIQKKNQ